MTWQPFVRIAVCCMVANEKCLGSSGSSYVAAFHRRETVRMAGAGYS